MARRLREAKSRLGEVVRQAANGDRQEVTGRGKRAAAIVSVKEHDRLARPTQSFEEVLLSVPDWNDELEVRA